ncbi:L-seryl-tRNA(Sec) selenium transferase [Virgibacillus kekensis]|uniref:L-seryl-tRNA(Sec) selenium transferase n=1 Tax=Virgibacillus kekensis TaxID=202261 RepID=A0ABV9DLZ5_9BACI
MENYLRELPPVHEIQRDCRFTKLCDKYQLTSERLTAYIRNVLGQIRAELQDGQVPALYPEHDFTSIIFINVEQKVAEWSRNKLSRVINGTGTVLHTNLGRARLSNQAAEYAAEVAKSYSTLEFNLSSGKRGSRHDIIEDLLKESAGAEAAMVVNNNAAAVFMILTALAKEREVIVSRGQLVEIGGSFRVSEIMEESGAYLKEIGTTNKTHLSDYENAINEETAMLMKVHTSNFRTIGFTKSVSTEELVRIGQKHNLLFYEDLGSGSLFDYGEDGIGEEPVVRQVIEAGADVVSFSGDKLLGGPQAGIIAGKKEIIDRLKKHQLARVLRVDKMTLAALEQTLKMYLTNREKEIPAIRDISRTAEEIRQDAEHFASVMRSEAASFRIGVEKSTSQVGGGTMPGVELPTFVATVTHDSFTEQELADRLRTCPKPIITRIMNEQVLIDFRTVTSEEIEEIINGFKAIEQEK